MLELLGVVGTLGPIILIVLVIVAIRHSGSISRLQSQVADLKGRIGQLESAPRATAMPTAPALDAQVQPVVRTPPIAPPLAPAPSAEVPEGTPQSPQPTEPGDAASDPPAPPAKQRFDWERLVGLRLPIWLGAIALSVAGFFFVSYAIESGFFTPEMRVFSAALASLAFLAAAEFVRRRVSTGNPAAIAAALAAASIATAYATAYLATLSYHLIPSGAGFIATAAVSVLAIAIALAFGEIVALIGIVGGFVAPLVYGSGDANAPFLVIYLLSLTAVTFGIIRYRNWWRLSVIGLIAPAFWGVVWGMTPALRSDTLWASILLMGFSAILAAATWREWRDTDPDLRWGERARVFTPPRLTLLAATALSGLGFFGWIAASRGGAGDLGLWQGLMAFAVIVVALGIASPAHRMVQIPVLVTYTLAILSWSQPWVQGAGIVIAAGAAIFGLSALDQFRRLREPALWASILAFIGVVFFVAAIFKTVGWHGALENRHIWALGALAIAAGFVVLLTLLGRRIEPDLTRSQVYAALGGAVTTLASLAVALELQPLYFPTAAALAIVGLAAVHLRVPVRGLRIVAAVYLVMYAMLLLGALSYGGDGLYAPPYLAYVFVHDYADHALALMVIPGIALLVAATLFQISRPAETRALVTVLDIAAIVVVVVGLFYLLVWPYTSSRWSETLVLASRIVGPELVVAAVAVYVGRRFDRAAAYTGGIVLTGIMMLGILGVLLIPLLAFWPPYAIPGTVIVNVTLVAYGVPALLLYFIGWYLRHDDRKGIRIYGIVTSVFAVVVTYAMLMLDIRQAFTAGAPTIQGEVSQSEFYAYSIGTLAFGLALLIGGVAFKHRGARAVSFFFVLAATIKVFLFDASELTGLWRVLSFLLMGLSFLGISWAYARFVFGIGLKAPPAAPPPVETPAAQT